MKKSFIALCGSVLFLASCEEKAPFINFGDTVKVDTTYVLATVPATDPHNVLIEEYTGQSCSNCPAAHAQLEQLETDNPGRINVIGMYVYGIQQSVPPAGHQYDFRDSTAWDIANTVYLGVNQLPSGGVDRVNVGGSIRLDKNIWNSNANTRKAITDSLNLAVESSYNSTTGMATVTATITYTQAVSSPHNLSIVMVEDSMVDPQEYPIFDPTFPDGVDPVYLYKNVFRGMISSAPFGDPVLATIPAKEKGRVYRRTYTYKPKTLTPAIKPEHCRVIAFVNSTSNTEIMQSVQTKLKP